MPLDIGALARQARQAASESAARDQDLQERVSAALHELRSQDQQRLTSIVPSRPSPPWLAGIPLGRLDARYPAPEPPPDYTVVSTDGSHVDQDHHAALSCWLINIGEATIRYGEGATARLTTRTELGYRPEQVWFVHDERRQRVHGQLLNVRRQVAEIAALADLCEANPGAVGLVDGTLLLSSPSRAVQPEPTDFLDEYLSHLKRIRAAGCLVASYISRPGAGDVIGALRFGCCPEPVCDRRCRLGLPSNRPCARLADLPDFLLYSELPLGEGERSGLWASSWPTNVQHYGEHRVHFFYFDAGIEIARVEVPAWVARDESALSRLHAVLAAQSQRGDDGYPRVLIEAHHLAVITGSDRRAFQALLDEALAGRGYRSLPSAKQRAKRRRAV